MLFCRAQNNRGTTMFRPLATALILMCTLLSLMAPAQQIANNGQIEGMVFDTQGLPISGARITVTQQQGSVRRTAVSTADRFRVDGLVPSIYNVLVEADGFDSQTVTADLRNQT